MAGTTESLILRIAKMTKRAQMGDRGTRASTGDSRRQKANESMRFLISRRSRKIPRTSVAFGLTQALILGF